MRSAVALVLFTLGCSSGGDQAPCEPFGEAPEPPVLENVLAVGRDSNDVLYVIDQPSGEELRVFESSEGRLLRLRVLGTGTGSQEGVEYYNLSVEAEYGYTLYLELRDEGEPLFVRTASRDDRNMPGAVESGAELEVLDEDALADLPVVDLTANVRVEYLGNLEDGRRVLVTVPSEGFSYEGFRLFLGTKDAMVEYPVGNVSRARDGGSTTIVFTLDGGEMATLDFSVVMVDMQFVAGPAMLTLVDGDTLAIDLIDSSPDALSQHTFVCDR